MNILDIAIAKKLAGGGGGSGTDNYNDLSNLPKINDTTLSGNKSSSALGLQSEINSDSKLASDLVDDTNQDNKFVTSTEKNTWNAKQNAIDNSHKLSSDLVDDTNHTNKFVTSTEKNTWNAKQNAIDADHKLSSSLVSFSTAEAAALASGIDSSKVGQISTNQTNILYVADSIGKNLFCPTVDSASSKGFTATRNTDNSYTVSGTRVGAADSVWIAIGEVSLPSGDYILSGAGGADSQLAISVDGTVHYDSGSGEEINAAIKNTLYIHIPSSYNTINVVVYPMICTEEAWNISHTYEPYALPNYDLTRLEAEDRASLAEVVDSGAKNLFEFGEFTGVNGATVTMGTDTVTVSGTQAWSKAYRKFKATTSGTYVLYYKITNNNSTHLAITVDSSTSGGTHYYSKTVFNPSTGVFYGEFTPPVNTDIYVVITSNNTSSTLSTAESVTVTDVMICTKAAFGVSTKFVPYRPDWDLVKNSVDYTTRMNVYGVGSVSNVNLNNIAVSEERVYNNPTNLPSGTSGYVICKTIIVDNSSGYQEIRFISSQINTIYSQSYPVFERRKVAGTWRDWHILDVDGVYRLDTGSTNSSSATISLANIQAGCYLMTTRCSVSPTDRKGMSIYLLWNITSDYTACMIKSIVETTGAKINTFSVTSDGTATITYDINGYHTTSLRYL